MPVWFIRFCALAVLCVPLGAAPTVPQKSTLQYGIEWRLVRAGTARITWNPAPNPQVEMHVESAGLVSKLYRVNDDYRAEMKDQLCASTVNIRAEEGKRRRDTSITFADGKASYLEKDLIKNAVVLSKETPTPACVYEYIGALQHLRSIKVDLGQSTQVPLSDGKRVANVKVEAQEREEVTTPLGKFKAIRHEILMFNDVLINKKARLFIWLTDDERRLPVQVRVRMQFLIGTIELKLEKQE